MRLSKRMVEMLKFIEMVDDPPTTRVGPGLPFHHANRVTHHALVQRGLIHTDAQGYIHLTEAGKQALHGNPGYSRRAKRFIGQKIGKLAHEGYEAPRRVAIAMEMARKRGLKVPKRNPEEDDHCYAVVDYGTKPIAGIRFMVQCLPDRPLDIPRGVRIMATRMTLQGARALADHLNDHARRGRAKIDVLKRPNPRFLRRGRHGAFFGVRRSNPTLAIMGANPPAAGDDIEATWAFLSYRRPDDPDGKRVVREHEFPDGFIAVPLADGTILLKHPQGHNLWTRR